MKRIKYILLFFILFFTSHFYLQVFPQTIKHSSTFGKVLTPKGDLRVLIIYAGFADYDEDQPYHNWGFGNSMPVYDPQELFFKQFDDFEKLKSDTSIINISRYYYELSNPSNRFRIVADVFPERINIDPSQASSFGDCNRLVMQKMLEKYPDFNWAPYDKRTNFPNYQFDNNNSPPDKKPDYVIIAYRYSTAWGKQPKEGMRSWAPNYSKLDGLNTINYNGYSFDGAGFTIANFNGKTGEFWTLFIHELAHELFSCPHYSGVNGAMGYYFYKPSMGWDMMNSTAGRTANSFERWLLGWTEIKNDLKDYNDNGTYYLRDNITTGDAIRIKIPHTKSQYLWIENHQKISILDHSLWRGGLIDSPKGSKGIPDKEKGIYMFIEDVLSDRTQIEEGMVYNLEKVNGIMPLNAAGNYDYKKPVKYTQSHEELWNNILYLFEKSKENTISGINPFICYRNDFDNNGVINHNVGPFGEYNGIKDSESYSIVKEILDGKPTLLYSNTGGRNKDALPFRRSDAFQKDDIINLSSNPFIINRPVYAYIDNKQTPYYLNGISINISNLKEGVYQLKIDFNKTEVNKNVRWCGNIVSKPVKNKTNKSDLYFSHHSELRLDRSGTPDKLTAPFVNATTFTIDSGSVVEFGKGSALLILEGSRVIVKKGGKLLMNKNTTLKIDNHSYLQVEEGGEIMLHSKSSINIPEESRIKVNPDIRRTLEKMIHIVPN